MCMIVDANRLGVFLSRRESENVKPIYNWLNNKNGKIVYSTGGKFKQEVKEPARRALVELARSGKASVVSERRLKPEKERLINESNHKSDDTHVLALALVSGARLLYTADQDLRNDFKRGKWKSGRFIIGNPRGKLYTGKGNSNLLTANVCSG